MSLRDPATNPNQQMKQFKDSAPCTLCPAPQAPQTDQHRDGFCPFHRKMVEDYWTGRPPPQQEAA